MKTNRLFYLIFFLLVCFTTMVKAQVSTNTVDYKITYDPATQVYSVFVVPNYSTPNANNLEAIEKGATAQVSLKVPNGFVISNITDVNGIWDKAPLKLGPNQQSQYSGQGLPADKAYYVIGKGASETTYGQFTLGTDVPLFTFTGNGCFGPIEIIQKADPFVTVSDNVLSFNTAPSFYSRSGQPAGGNQQPLEQYIAPAGAPANCFSLTNDTFTASTNTATPLNVLANDSFGGSTPIQISQVNVSVPNQPANGTVSVNPDGTLTYTSNPGFAGVETIIYQVCDKANPTVCQTATVTVTVSCPIIAAPVASVTAQPTCTVTTGAITVTSPANGSGISYTVTGTNPVRPAVTNTTGTFTTLASGVYSVTSRNAAGCISSPLSLTVNAQPATPAAVVATVTAQPTCTVTTGAITVTSPANGSGISYTITGTSPVRPAVNSSTGAFSGLAPGVYSVTTTNASGCTSSGVSFTINQQPPTPAAAVASVTAQPSCAVATGTITVSSPVNALGVSYTVTGTNPVRTAVSNTTGTFTGLAAGVYSVTTTNASGCTSTPVSLTINAQPATPAAPIASVTSQPSCAVSTGTVTVTSPANGSGISYTVTGTNPVRTAVSNTSGTFTGLAAGVYSVTTTNASGCASAPVSLTINAQPATPAAPVASVTSQPSCAVSTGTVTVTSPANGSGISYTVTGTNPVRSAVNSSTGAFSGLAPGVYSVTTTNASGCTSTPVSLTINAQPATPAAPVASVTSQPSCAVSTGTVTVTSPTNGSGISYTVTGTNPVRTAVSNTSGTFTGLAAGVYSVTTTNASGCVSAPVSLTINAQPATPAAPVASTPVTYCQAAVATALTATAAPGSTLRWYTVPTGGVGSTTAPVPSTSVLGTTSFYVSSLNTSGCESTLRTKIDVIVNVCRVIYAYNDNNITPVNTTVQGSVLTNDDLNNGTGPLVVSTTPVLAPLHGTVTLNANGTYNYVPTANYTGVDSFQYRVCDSGSPAVCDIATVTIDIYGPIDPTINNEPIALGDIFSTPKGTAVSGNVLTNDTDPDAGQTLTATKLSNPTNGTVTLNSDGTFTYLPNTGFVGTDSFIYTACDNGNPTACDDAVVQIVVKETPVAGFNQPPVAGDDFVTTPNGIAATGNLLTNDKDPENTALVINTTPISGPTNGTIVINPNGTYVYTPTLGTAGSDKVVYEVCDSGSPIKCTQATLFIQVTNGQVAIRIKAYLQGSLFGVNAPDMLMRDDLRVKSLIPTTSPYPAMGFTALTPTANAGSSVFTPTGADAIVDWVFVELRSATNNLQVIDSRSALIQRDGDIVDIDGVTPLTFMSAQPASYYVVVKHRNHLSVMTKTAIPLTSVPTLVDFTLPSTPTYTINSQIINQAQVVVDQGVAMWAGNSLYDNQVIYQGTQNDINPIYQLVINATGNFFVTPFFKLKTYNNGDINMNGETIFQGTQNDVEFIYQNIIKNHPGNVLKQNFFIIREQLP